MQRVVLDTNVVISGLIGKGKPRRILELVFKRRIIVVLSSPTLNEYSNVIDRPKFSRYQDFNRNAANVLKLLQSISLRFEPTIQLKECSDEDDNKFLELAVEAKANFLITGNLKHFPAKIFHGVQIVSPSEFLSFIEN